MSWTKSVNVPVKRDAGRRVSAAKWNQKGRRGRVPRRPFWFPLLMEWLLLQESLDLEWVQVLGGVGDRKLDSRSIIGDLGINRGDAVGDEAALQSGQGRAFERHHVVDVDVNVQFARSFSSCDRG